MSSHSCKICKKLYNKNENKPFLLTCGDTICLACIKGYKEALNKDTFECPTCCCGDAKSTGFENKGVYPTEEEIRNASNISQISQAPVIGEFEIFIRPKDETEKYSIKVTKSMTVGQLKDKIQSVKGYNKANYKLAFKRPLADETKTLESYGITKTVTITQISVVEGGF